MPRVKLGRDADAERRTATKGIIRMAMNRQGIWTQRECAARLGKSQPWFSQRLKDNSWKLEDMVLLSRVLKFTPEEAAAILGVK